MSLARSTKGKRLLPRCASQASGQRGGPRIASPLATREIVPAMRDTPLWA